MTEAFHPRTMEEVAQSLVVLFEDDDQATALIKHFIDLEMSKANEGGKFTIVIISYGALNGCI